VIDLLTELRFEPQPAMQPDTVRLTTCPLLDAARRNPDVVCEVHLGIVRGVLERLGGNPDGTALLPFAEPGACLLTLPGRS
jgi:predicted ArsR family transcriptional regulator